MSRIARNRSYTEYGEMRTHAKRSGHVLQYSHGSHVLLRT
jgi:hypothetical protein